MRGKEENTEMSKTKHMAKQMDAERPSAATHIHMSVQNLEARTHWMEALTPCSKDRQICGYPPPDPSHDHSRSCHPIQGACNTSTPSVCTQQKPMPQATRAHVHKPMRTSKPPQAHQA
eukprot:1063948-Pelagomonas_calceolata.AAC.4